MSWVPTNDFEEEIVSLQPDYNFIFGNNIASTAPEAFYPRPSAHLQFAAKQKNLKKQQQRQGGGQTKTSAHSQKLSVIAKVQRIAGTKPLGEQPTINDWDTNDNIERETVAMMRHCGLGPSIEEPLDERCTIATLPITEDVRIMHNGPKRMPIFFDEKFFKLKPRVSNSSSGVYSSGTTPNGSSDSANNSFVSAASASSVSTDDNANNVETGRYANYLRADDAEINYEKLPNNADDNDNSSESLSCFATAAEETPLETEDSYTTAETSKRFIPSNVWYRSGADSNKTGSRPSSSNKSSCNQSAIRPNGNSCNNNKKSWRSGSSTSSSLLSSPASYMSSSSHHSYTPPQRFYSARELYERKRHN